jgi:hypothetical protein
MLCRRPSSSSIKDRREADTTALLRRVSTFVRPVRTLDPARGSSSACAPSLSSSSSIGNRSGRDLRRRSVTMGISSSCEPPDDARFICVGTGSGLRIFLYERVRYEDWSRCIGLGYARVELRLGVVDALPHTPFPARYRRLGICRAWQRYWWRTREARCREVR